MICLPHVTRLQPLKQQWLKRVLKVIACIIYMVTLKFVQFGGLPNRRETFTRPYWSNGGSQTVSLTQNWALWKHRQREGHVPRHEEVRRQMQRQLDTLNVGIEILGSSWSRRRIARCNFRAHKRFKHDRIVGYWAYSCGSNFVAHTTLVEANDKLKWTNMDLLVGF